MRISSKDEMFGFAIRVNEVNTSDKYLYKIQKVIVSGSYLSDVDKLGDIDLAITLDFVYSNRQGIYVGY